MDQTELLRIFERQPDRAIGLKELLGAMKRSEAKEKNLRRALKDLVEAGKLEREEGRRFRLTRTGQPLEGRIAVDDAGRPMLVTGGGRPIPVEMGGTTPFKEGDRVKARFITVGRRGRVRAKVEEVIDAPRGREVGLLRRLGRAIFIEPESKSRRGQAPPAPIVVSEDETLGALDGQLVIYEVTRPRTATQGAHGCVITVLGKPGDRETEIQRILLENEMPPGFPEEVLVEASAFGEEVDPAETARRRDIRHIPLVTIDSETARDFDDAVCVERDGEHGYRLYVAIADVSHYVEFGHPLDVEALRRATSVYLTDRVIPMLPEQLSNNLCSLKPQVDRLCVVAEMRVDREGHVHDTSFYRAVMRSHARLTYTRVSKALDGEPDEECRALLPSILRLAKVAQLLLARRLLRGSIDLDLPEAEIVYGADKMPTDVIRRERNDAHRLIEDLMLAANEAVAGYFEDRDLPSIFRIHEDPDPLKLETFVALCQSLGLPVKLKKKIRPKDIAILLDSLSTHPAAKSLHSLLLRTLAQARYYPENEGHFGLAAERYLHFTSPIRRYPDLMVHRLLMASLAGDDKVYTMERLREIADQSSAMERKAMIVERSSKDLDRCYVAAAHLGERRKANVTTLLNFGMFAALEAPFIEGLIPIQSLGDDYYVLDEYGAFLRGQRTGRTFHLGMPIEVEIASVSLQRRQVDLRIAPSEAERAAAGDGGADEYQRDEFPAEKGHGGGRRFRPAPAPAAKAKAQVPGSSGKPFGKPGKPRKDHKAGKKKNGEGSRSEGRGASGRAGEGRGRSRKNKRR